MSNMLIHYKYAKNKLYLISMEKSIKLNSNVSQIQEGIQKKNPLRKLLRNTIIISALALPISGCSGYYTTSYEPYGSPELYVPYSQPYYTIPYRPYMYWQRPFFYRPFRPDFDRR